MTDEQMMKIDELLIEFESDEDLEDLIDYLKSEKLIREDLKNQLERLNKEIKNDR